MNIVAGKQVMKEQVQAAVLAGGRSRRLGMDKALLPLNGRSLLQITVDTLFPLFGQVLVIGRSPVPELAAKALFYEDLEPGEKSSLAGLYSALSRVTARYALVVAVDMPFLRPALLAAMVDSLRAGDDVLIPCQGEYLQPLCALYSTRCLSYVREALERGEKKVRSFFSNVNVNYLPVEKLRPCDPQLVSFFNINTPEDYSRAKQLISR